MKSRQKGEKRKVVVVKERDPEPVILEKPQEEIMDKNSTSAIPAPVTRTNQFEICPVCGFYSKIAERTNADGKVTKYLVCKGCSDRFVVYTKQAAAALLAGKETTTLSKIEWVLSQLDLPHFEQELETTRQIRSGAETRINEIVRAKVNGRTMPKEIIAELWTQARQEINNNDYFLVRRLNARLQAAKKLKSELEQLAEKAAHTAAPTSPALESVTS